MRFVDFYYILGGKKGSWIQRKWSDYCINRKFEKKKKFLHKNGILVLNKFQEACNKSCIKGWLEFGTLLGAYREKSFISHDFDLDVGLYAEDYTEVFDRKMHQLGFKKDHSFYLFDVENKLKILSEVTYTYNGFAIDIFLSQKNEDHRTVYVFIANGTDNLAVNKYDLEQVSPIEVVYINNNSFNAPNNPKRLLGTIYGPNFMIPDPNWRTASDENKLVCRLSSKNYYGIFISEE